MDIIIKINTTHLATLDWLERAKADPRMYLRPAWGFKPGTYIDPFTKKEKFCGDLFVWCDEHLRWNHHGLLREEAIPGTITSRVPHHECGFQYGQLGDGSVFYCMGIADKELAKRLKRYSLSNALSKCPPPVRRVYPDFEGQRKAA